jgi:hypothetical protein
MPRWTGIAILGGAVFQVVFIGLIMLVIRSQADAQTAEAVGEASVIVSEFTRSVDVFNFVIIASFVGYAGSLFVIQRMSREATESRDLAVSAVMAEMAEGRRAHEREVGVLTGLVLKSQENTLESIKALVDVSDVTDEARNELKATGTLVQGFMDTALPAITSAYRESDLAKHDRDMVVAGFRQSIDVFMPKFTDTSERIDLLLTELRARGVSGGKMNPPPDSDI